MPSDPEVLLWFEVSNNGTERIVRSQWLVRSAGIDGSPEVREDREERFDNLHQLQVRLLGLARQIDWVIRA